MANNIQANENDILSFVNKLNKKIQFIHDDNDSVFEYSIDGATWQYTDSAWFPNVSADGKLSWERKVTWEQPESMNIKGDKGEPGLNGTGFFTMRVDAEGNLYANMPIVDTNLFRLDPITGNLFYMVN